MIEVLLLLMVVKSHVAKARQSPPAARDSGSSSTGPINGGPAGPGLGGLFAGGIPKLKPSGSRPVSGHFELT